MNLTNLLSREGTLAALRRVLLLFTLGYLGTAPVIGGGALYFGQRAARATEDVKRHRAEAFEARKIVARGRSTPNVEAPKGIEGVAAFQAVAVGVAQNLGCSLGEFRSSQEVLPFVSRFNTTAPSGEWGQVEVQVELEGRTADVMKTLRAWAEGDVPIEYDSVEIGRTDPATSEIRVKAKVALRVIVAKEAVKA